MELPCSRRPGARAPRVSRAAASLSPDLSPLSRTRARGAGIYRINKIYCRDKRVERARRAAQPRPRRAAPAGAADGGAGPRAAPRMTSIYVTPFSKCFDIYKAPSTQNTKYYSTTATT